MLTLTESCIILCLEWGSKDDKTPVSINVEGWSVYNIYARLGAVITHMGGFINKLLKMI